MSTEPSSSGPDQQEPVGGTSEATPGAAPEPTPEPQDASEEQVPEDTPATEEAPVAEEAPVTERALVTEEAPVTEQATVTEEASVTDAALVAVEAPAAAEEPSVAQEPSVVEEPVPPVAHTVETDTPQETGASQEPGAAEATATPPVPTPTPRPRPLPGAPRPSGAAPHRATGPVAPAAVTPPLAVGAIDFGRVEETGVVHVRDGDGEREVGQYPDVPPAEALAFYVRKYEDLAAQVHLLGQRLDNGTVPAKEARSSLGSLREAGTDAKVVGDLPALRAELDRFDTLVAERSAVEDAQRAQAKAQALAEREAIVSEAEQIAATPPASMHFKHAGERMQELLDAWKTAQRSGTRIDKRSEDPLWKRFAAARSTVDRLRRAHFAQVSSDRSETRSTKEGLISRAEELQTSTDWRAASEEYRTLMDGWKAAGRLSRKDDDTLWARFRAAQDVFFAARAAANSAQDEEYRGNLEVKDKLLAEAEALLPVTDLDRARKALASIQDRWDDAGRVPRGDLDRIENRLRAVMDTIRDADTAKWGKGKPEVVARGSGLVQQLRQQVADLDAKVVEAEARGDSRTASRAAKERATKQAWLDQAQASLDDLSR